MAPTVTEEKPSSLRSTTIISSSLKDQGFIDVSSASNLNTTPSINGKGSSITNVVDSKTTTPSSSSELKIILLGDSAVGKSKLIERFLIQSYSNYTSSTRALSIYKYAQPHPVTKLPLNINFYDTAGQERFASMHSGYYYGAHACLLCFDLTRKTTYKNLNNWYNELRHYRPNIPVLLLANKVDEQKDMANRDFKFALDNKLDVMFVSASDGTNVVRAFDEIIQRAVQYKDSDQRDFMDDVLDLLRDDNPLGLASKESIVKNLAKIHFRYKKS